MAIAINAKLLEVTAYAKNVFLPATLPSLSPGLLKNSRRYFTSFGEEN